MGRHVRRVGVSDIRWFVSSDVRWFGVLQFGVSHVFRFETFDIFRFETFDVFWFEGFVDIVFVVVDRVDVERGEERVEGAFRFDCFLIKKLILKVTKCFLSWQWKFSNQLNILETSLLKKHIKSCFKNSNASFELRTFHKKSKYVCGTKLNKLTELKQLDFEKLSFYGTDLGLFSRNTFFRFRRGPMLGLGLIFLLDAWLRLFRRFRGRFGHGWFVWVGKGLFFVILRFFSTKKKNINLLL